MKTLNIWSLSTVIIVLVIFAVLTSNILLIPWNYFIKDDKNIIEWITLIFTTSTLIWSLLLYKLLIYKQHKKITEKLKYTKEYNFNKHEDTKRVTQLLQEKNISQDDIEYRVDGATDLKDDPQRVITNSPIALNHQKKKIILIPGFFLARFRNHPKTFASVLTHEIAHFNNQDISIIHKIRVLLKSIITVFTLSIILLIITSIYADIQKDSNQFIYAIQASIVGKNYLIFQGLVIFLLALIHKQLDIWREALADNESVKHFGKEELIKSEKLLNLKQQFIRATSFHLNNVQMLSPIWVFIAGMVIEIFSSRLAGTLSYLFTDNKQHLFDIADTTSNLLIYSGFFYILTTFFKNIKKKDGHFIQLLLVSSILLILGNYTTFLFIEALPQTISSTLMPEGYDYIFRYNPLATLISSTQIISENSTIMLFVLISLFIGYSQKKIYIGYILGFTFFITLLLERAYFPHILNGWLTLSIFTPLFIFLYKNNYQYNINKKSYLLALLIISFSSLDYFGFTNINHFSKIQMQLGNKALKNKEINQAIMHYKEMLKISPHNLDTTIYLMQLLAQNQQINEAIKISENAKSTIKYYEPSWNKLYQYYIISGSLRLERNQPKDLDEAKKLYHQAEYMYRNNSRLENNSSQFTKILFYNLICMEAKNQNYTKSSAYLLEYIAYFKDESIMKDNDIALLVMSIKNHTIPPKKRLFYLKNIIKETNYKYTEIETMQLINKGQINQKDIYTLLKFWNN